MKELWITTFIWAFSYSIIGQFISPALDPYFAVLLRSLIGLGIFLFFIKPLSIKLSLRLIIIGSLQFGITYILLYQSFQYLNTPEILLFSITTPLFVTLIDDLLQKKFNPNALICAFIAVIGAFIIRYDQLSTSFLTGLLLMQCANLTFACGQVFYRASAHKIPHGAQHTFAYFFLGACIVNLIACLFLADFSSFGFKASFEANKISNLIPLLLALIFVGVFATALGQFLWCLGAKKVTSGTLAIMNNAVIPIGIIVNLIFWNKPTNYLSLSIGAMIMLVALLLNYKLNRLSPSSSVV